MSTIIGPIGRGLASIGAFLTLALAGALVLAGTALLDASPAGAAPSTTYFTYGTPILGGWAQLPLGGSASAPATAPQGGAFTLALTPSAATVPTSQDGGAIALYYTDEIRSIIPVPAGATFDPAASTASVTGTYSGGTNASLPSSGSFTVTVTYCSSSNGTTCTATPQNLTAASSSTSPVPFAGSTSLPYIEESTGSTELPAGATFTYPTTDLVFTASGPVGTAFDFTTSEFDSTVNLQLVGTLSVSGWPTGTTALPPTALTSTSPIPPAAPVVMATTTVTAPNVVPQTITFTSTPPAGATVGGGETVSATGGGSGNPVTFSVDPSSALGACTIIGAKVSFVGNGICVIDADQAGAAGYGAAPEVQQSVTIAPGTASPVGAVGALSVAALAGMSLVMVQRRRRQAGPGS